ncbi:hypothetical protein B1B_13796, partial [mine drainage metagenome]
MQNYPVRTTHRPNLDPARLEALLREHFGTASASGTDRSTSWGALTNLVVRAAGKELQVEVTMNPKVPVEVAGETVARYNRFLQAATGYTAKERAKRLRKSSA